MGFYGLCLRAEGEAVACREHCCVGSGDRRKEHISVLTSALWTLKTQSSELNMFVALCVYKPGLPVSTFAPRPPTHHFTVPLFSLL